MAEFVDSVPSGTVTTAPSKAEDAGAGLSVTDGGLIVRFVGCLEQVIEWISDGIIETDVARIRVVFDDVADCGGGLDRFGFKKLLDFCQEVRRLVELNGVALAVEKALEECLLGPDERGDTGFDALFRDQVVNVDGQFLADPVDAADSLFEDRWIPWELDVDDAVRGVLEIEPDGPRHRW